MASDPHRLTPGLVITLLERAVEHVETIGAWLQAIAVDTRRIAMALEEGRR